MLLSYCVHELLSYCVHTVQTGVWSMCGSQRTVLVDSLLTMGSQIKAQVTLTLPGQVQRDGLQGRYLALSLTTQVWSWGPNDGKRGGLLSRPLINTEAEQHARKANRWKRNKVSKKCWPWETFYSLCWNDKPMATQETCINIDTNCEMCHKTRAA